MLKKINRLLLFTFLIFSTFSTFAFNHPHLIVNDGDKAQILSKIETQPWAQHIFSEMKQRLYPFVSQYRMTTEYDPTWLTSRYLMNREKGSRFTNLKVNATGLEIDSLWGDAPVPTIRYSIGEERPGINDIFPLRPPAIDELVPYNKNSEIPFYNQITHKYEKVDPSRFSEVINGEINQIALDAAIIYWLTDEKEYARLAADVLQQWGKAAFYQNPIKGCKQSGLFSSTVSGDTEYASLILVYDFLADFLKEYKYDTSFYQPVFEKIAWTLISRGSLENYAIKNPMLVFSTLSVEDTLKREKLMGYLVDVDSIVSRDYGNLSLNTAISRFFSPSGFYKDPGKHASAVNNILLSTWVLEKNDIPILNAYPALLQAGDVRLYSAFPDLSLSSFGDVSNVYSDGNLLEMSLSLSLFKKKGEADQKRALLDLLVQNGRHHREDTDWQGLLLYSAQPAQMDLPNDFWTRSGEIDYAHFYFQRNGTDPSSGLMLNVQGGTYSGNHANGMSAEFYGAGRVLGIDPGIGRNLGDSLHIQYYSQWAAHNTVVAAGSSSPERIYKGGGTSKSMGQIDLIAMEPMPMQEAISPSQSFIETRYFETFTRTNQERLLGLVRTSPVSGFYVDICRSNNKLWNDYLYHNIGDKLEILSEDRKPLPLHPQKIRLVEPDFPGMRFITNTKATDEYNKGIISLFSFKDTKNRTAYMQSFMPANADRTYFSGFSPKAESATTPYDSVRVPTLVVHQMGDAWNEPFVSVFEPYVGKDNYNVQSVEWLNRSHKGAFTALNITCKDNLRFWVLQSIDASRRGIIPDGSFMGTYATIEFRQDTLHAVYLGKGAQVECKGFSLKGENSECSANIHFGDNYLDITSNQQIQIRWKTGSKQIYLLEKGSDEKITITKPRRGDYFTIPAVQEGRLFFEK
ncbi:MAG: heparinase II/III family protein [Bacteroidales bacterium]|nr:heparinase II/III family protein [Bacteroidales bacterium]